MSLHKMGLERRPRYHALKVVQLIDLMQKFLTDVEGRVYTPTWIKGYVQGRRELLDEMLKDAKRDLQFEEDQLGMKRDPRPSEAQAIRLTAEDKKKIAEAKPPAPPANDVQHRFTGRLAPTLGYCTCGWPKTWNNCPTDPVPYKQWKAHARAAAKRGEIVDYGAED